MNRLILSLLAIAALTAGTLALTAPAAAQDAEPRHGLSVFGDLKYPDGFSHFAYVNPDAPKGGRIKVPGLDTFETVHPFILKGRKEVLAEGLLFDTLMARSFDEPDSYYGLVAQTVEQPADRTWVAFNIDPRAKFHDGTPITADDIVFTFNALTKDGHPRYRINFRDVERAEATSPGRVKFTFKPGTHRDLPTRLASLPVLSKAYYDKVDFDRTTFEAPLASGPYRVKDFEPGRSITYGRVEDYWAKDLPVSRGRFNFDEITIEYYRDREVAFQAFFSNQYDYREEFTSRQWAIQYDEPPVNEGLIVRETLPDETPSGVQAFILNLRRDKFKDIRVRTAMDLAFDFEWTNRTLFYDLYERTNSMFENSDLAARQPPSADELARIINPMIRNLKRLGIQASVRIVDVANFKRRQDSFDFDVVVRRISQPLTPGLEQRNYFGSEFANVEGSSNISGIQDPVVDALIEKVISADTRDALTTAVRALDRVLMWNRFAITQWYKGSHNVAYWNKFSRPEISPKFNPGVLDTWWYDEDKATMIEDGEAPPPPPGALPPPGRK